MRVVRLLAAGAIAVLAMMGVVFTAILVLLGGLCALAMQLIRGRVAGANRMGYSGPRGRTADAPPAAGRPGEVIDIEATRLPSDPPAS